LDAQVEKNPVDQPGAAPL